MAISLRRKARRSSADSLLNRIKSEFKLDESHNGHAHHEECNGYQILNGHTHYTKENGHGSESAQPISSKFLPISNVPRWMYVDWIYHGYRNEKNSYWECFKTLFSIHNQTGNIWTHLIPLMYYIYLSVDLLMGNEFELKYGPIHGGLLFIYYMGVILCLGSSAFYHLFSCHSESACHCWERIDHVGILSAFICSELYVTFYGFHKHPTQACLYLIVLVYLSYLVISFLLTCDLIKDEPRRMKLLLFLFLFGILLVLKISFMNQTWFVLKRFAITYVWYGFGLAFYVSRYPERAFPDGRFSLFATSHQIWHLCIVGGAFNFNALVHEMFDWYLHDNWE